MTYRTRREFLHAAAATHHLRYPHPLPQLAADQLRSAKADEETRLTEYMRRRLWSDREAMETRLREHFATATSRWLCGNWGVYEEHPITIYHWPSGQVTVGF